MDTRQKLESFEKEIADIFYNRLLGQNLAVAEAWELSISGKKAKIEVTENQLKKMKDNFEKLKRSTASYCDYIALNNDQIEDIGKIETAKKDSEMSLLFAENLLNFAENNCPETVLEQLLDDMDKVFSVKK